jgi:hypothetical protein
MMTALEKKLADALRAIVADVDVPGHTIRNISAASVALARAALADCSAPAVHVIEDHMRAEYTERSPCALSVRLRPAGDFRAMLRFGPGMESASGDGATVADAIARLEHFLTR